MVRQMWLVPSYYRIGWSIPVGDDQLSSFGSIWLHHLECHVHGLLALVFQVVPCQMVFESPDRQDLPLYYCPCHTCLWLGHINQAGLSGSYVFCKKNAKDVHRFSSSVMLRNLTVETFVRIESRILMWIAYFWLEIIIYEVLLTLRESLLVFNTYQLPIHSGMDIVNVTVGCKNCCIFSKMHLIWGSIHVVDIQQKRYWARHRALWNTQCNLWDRGTAVFDWDVLFPVTQIRLKPVLHDISDAIMQELTHH